MSIFSWLFFLNLSSVVLTLLAVSASQSSISSPCFPFTTRLSLLGFFSSIFTSSIVVIAMPLLGCFDLVLLAFSATKTMLSWVCGFSSIQRSFLWLVLPTMLFLFSTTLTPCRSRSNATSRSFLAPWNCSTFLHSLVFFFFLPLTITSFSTSSRQLSRSTILFSCTHVSTLDIIPSAACTSLSCRSHVYQLSSATPDMRTSR
mmetsp:Transcript_12427/g.24660  ORF Transcript_12427/g.24660 Transcript_12427/m.24660 type:complete len:202 (-) Transcript_12427:395-1000(-)